MSTRLLKKDQTRNQCWMMSDRKEESPLKVFHLFLKKHGRNKKKVEYLDNIKIWRNLNFVHFSINVVSQ